MKRYFATWAICMIATWAVCAFVSLQLNPFGWTVEARAIYLVFGGIICAFLAAIIEECR